MSFSGGVFSINTAGQPVVAGTTISATVENALTADLATGLSTCLLKDGTQTTTAVIPFLTGITLAGGTTFSKYIENTFVPTVTLVGGAGNTVPVYTTNTGRYTREGNRVFVDIYLTGDGGAEGAGTGVLTIAIPITSGASFPAGTFLCGTALNGTNAYLLCGSIGGGGGVISLSFFSSITNISSMTGDDQNNTTRSVRLNFFYEV